MGYFSPQTRLALVLVSVLAVTGCKQTNAPGAPNAGAAFATLPTGSSATGPSATTPFDVLVTWTANREKAVNSAGGGYTLYVYHALGAGSQTLDQTISVPYVAGPTAPTSYTVTGLTLHAPWIYHFKIVAFSALLNTSSVAATSAVSNDVTAEAP